MLDILIKGSWLMIPLVICSVITLAVLIDRFLAFRRLGQIDMESLRAQVMDHVRHGRVYDAAKLCASTPGPVSAVLLTGLQTFVKLRRQDESMESVRTATEKSMEDYTMHAMSAVEKRLNILASIGNAAPLIGMTGTVTGMIKAFDKMSNTAGLSASTVASGISEALITTAAGLLIALAAVIPYNYFTSTSEKIELEVDEASTELLEYLTINRQPVTKSE